MLFDKEYQSNLEARVFQEAREMKEAGTKVVGVYCAFTPREIISAAGALPVALCAGGQKPIERAEHHLPRVLCPLIKSSYGHALSDTCPYFHAADHLVADATCDGKKKMFELLDRIKPVHVLNLPQTSTGEASLAYWMEELTRLIPVLEALTGQAVTDDALREQIALHNAFRNKKKELCELNRGPLPLVTGREVEAITGSTMFDCNLEERIVEIDQALAELKKRSGDESFLASMKDKPRILLTGCPTTNRKVFDIIEDSGAVVAAQENCGGLKTLSLSVAEEGDPLRAIADRYLSIPCSCMTPNGARLDLIGELVRDYHIDAVVELTWEACHTYNVEAFQVQEFVKERCGLPYIQIRTDYSENDSGQIRTRIEAFLEILAVRLAG